MTNEELIELKELAQTVRPFGGNVSEETPEEADRRGEINQKFLMAYLVLPDLIDELLRYRDGGTFGSDLSNFNL